jgi:hypothetical protein
MQRPPKTTLQEKITTTGTEEAWEGPAIVVKARISSVQASGHHHLAPRKAATQEK